MLLLDEATIFSRFNIRGSYLISNESDFETVETERLASFGLINRWKSNQINFQMKLLTVLLSFIL
jgi:hypothetical protein